MSIQRITGGGGVQLHVIDTGSVRGRPIVFVHGFSQCGLCWSRQLTSELADDHRLIAVDLRGHGQSDRPASGYDDSRLWADDIDAVIRTLHLEQPILCAWSYGLPAIEYIRHYGDDAIGGLHLVSAITKVGTEDTISVLTPEFLSLVPGLFAANVDESVRSLQSLLRLCFLQEPSAEDLYLMLGYNVSVPPYVRQALFSRSIDNDDVLMRIRKPVLLTHGAHDAIVRPAVVDRHKARVSHAQVDIMPDAGHAPFWEQARTFNRRLRDFVASVCT
jgi:pimeloyl-ACP methyl ester carboxylesterase